MQRTIFYLFATVLFFGVFVVSVLLEQQLKLDSRGSFLYMLAQSITLVLFGLMITWIHRRTFGRK
jgi:drug/metabolite transporter superfamily protein YnfA